MQTPFSMTRAVGCAALSGLVSMALVACGGGGGGDLSPSVSNLSATPVMYGQTVSLTITGSNLNAAGGITAALEPGCGPMTRASAGDASQIFRCKILATGDLRAHVRTAEGKELASVRLDVPIPRVSMTVEQGQAKGKMIIELDPGAAPRSVENFLTYINTGSCWYKDVLFHRVVADFVVQAGAFTNGLAAKTGVGAAIPLESNNGLKNLRGTIAMARTDAPDSATSQFYFNVKDNPALDYASAESPGYAVFGRVLPNEDQGLAVIDAIAAVPVQSTTSNNITFPHLPVNNVVISACGQVR